MDNSVDDDIIGKCCNWNCGNCPAVTIEIKQVMPSNKEYSFMDFTYCKVSKNKLSLNHCLASKLEPFKLLSLFTYVIEMYNNRKVINRKNSPSKKAYDNNNLKISVVEQSVNKDSNKSNDDSVHIIDIRNHYSYEKQVRQGSMHSSHKSPIEHERQGHQRIYRNKDGSIRKIVDIKPCIINKGKSDNVITFYN